MKTLNNYINEALIKKDTKIKEYIYRPKSRDELIEIIKEKINNLSSDGLLNLSDINISDVDKIEYLFQKIIPSMRNKIKKININNWDISKFNNLTSMFFNCEMLEEIVGIEKFNTENITSINCMFYQCKKLKKLDLSKWNVKKLINFDNTFFGCESLVSVGDIEHWLYDLPVDIDRGRAKYGYHMFNKCNRKLKRPSWNKYLRKK